MEKNTGLLDREDIPDEDLMALARFLKEMRQEEPWREFAACRDTDPDMFVLKEGQWPKRSSTRAAKDICSRCVVVEDCGEYASRFSSDILYGIWAGKSDSDRKSG